MALALLAIAAGAAFRAWHVFRDPLWLDEAYSAYAAAGGFGFLWHVVPSYETHPPFYYSLVRLWSLAFGDGLAALRSLGLAAGLLVLPATWWAARGLARLTGIARWSAPLVALGAVALASGLIEMSRDVRPYAVMALVYAVAIGALLRAAAPVRTTGRLAPGAFALYCAALATMLWLHNLGPLYGAALGTGALCLVARRGLPRATWGVLLGGHALAGLVYLPGLLILADQAPTWVHATWLRFRFDGDLFGTVAVLWAARGPEGFVASAILFVSATFALRHCPEGLRAAAALLVAALLPLVLSIALSMTIAPVFIPRTLTPLAVPAALLFAAAVTGAGGLWRWLAWAAATILFARMLSDDILARRDERPKQDWYAALRWLAPRYRTGDVVLAYPNEGALPFDRAVRDKRLAIVTRAIPAPVPAFADAPGKWNPTGSRGVVSLSRARLRAIAQSPAIAAVPTVWLMRLGPWAYDRKDVFLDELKRDRVVTAHILYSPIDIYGLRRRDLAPVTPGSPGPVSSGRAGPAGAAAAR